MGFFKGAEKMVAYAYSGFTSFVGTFDYFY